MLGLYEVWLLAYSGGNVPCYFTFTVTTSVTADCHM